MKFLNTPFKLTRWFQSCTGEYAMKLPKQVLILLLCCSLARFTAQAESFGPTGQANEQQPAPLNGYMFRILTKQGPHAPGGAKNYVVNGKMTAGCAFVAYPVEYRSSG